MVDFQVIQAAVTQLDPLTLEVTFTTFQTVT